MKRLVRALCSAAMIEMALASPALASCISTTGVFGSVSQSGPSTWLYSFMVRNGCVVGGQPYMTDFYLPFFADAGITDITVPPPDAATTNVITWTATILPDNLFGLAGAGVIDFHVSVSASAPNTPPPEPEGVGYYVASGFSFTAGYDGVDGPGAILQTQYNGGAYDSSILLFNDPPIPGSPLALEALGATSTPEPSTLTLLAIGLGGMAVMVRRRRRA